MAWAKSAIPCFVASSPAASWGSFETIFAAGNGTPMMPVDEGKISRARNPSNRARCRQTCRQAWIPASPVAQLALPEFTITARTRPRVADSDARPTARGAATTRFRVNTAAAVVPGQASASARSGRPLALIPAQAAENLKPAGRHITCWGRARTFIPRSSPASWQAEEAWRIWATRRAPWRLRRNGQSGGRRSNLCGFCRGDLRAGPW